MCYGVGLIDLERPEITGVFRYWERLCITWEAYLRWETRGSGRGIYEPLFIGLVSFVPELEENAALLLISTQSTHVGSNVNGAQ